MIKITKKTKLVRSFKLPRKYKKDFKKSIIGFKSNIFFNPFNKSEDIKKIVYDYLFLLKQIYHMNKFNLKEYKGTKEIFNSIDHKEINIENEQI